MHERAGSSVAANEGLRLWHETVYGHTFFAMLARGSMLAGRGVGLILITHQLGSTGFGTYSLLLVTYNIAVCLAGFGMEHTNLYLAGRRRHRVPLLVGNSLILALGLGLAAAVLLGFAVHLLEHRIFTGAPAAAVLITALALPAAVAHNALTGIVLGLGRFRYYGVVETLKWLLYLVALGWLEVKGALDVASALATFYGTLCVTACAHFVVLGAWSRSVPRTSFRVVRRTMRIGRGMLLVHLTTILGARIDVYAVRVFGSMASVGVYALVMHLSELLLHLARPFAVVVFSGTARGQDATRLHLRSLTRVLIVAGAIFGVAAFVGRAEILGFLFGKDAAGSGPLLLLRMPGVLAMALCMLVGGELLGRGRTDRVWQGNVVGVAALALLVGPLAAWAATRGTAAAYTVAALVHLAWLASVLRGERARKPLVRQPVQRASVAWSTGGSELRMPTGV
jgi:O-antigen/teichoic acid export membrane protein